MFATLLPLLLPILSPFVPIGVRLFGSWLDHVEAKAEVKAAFQAFVAQMYSTGLLAAELRNDSEKQREDLKKQDPKV